MNNTLAIIMLIGMVSLVVWYLVKAFQGKTSAQIKTETISYGILSAGLFSGLIVGILCIYPLSERVISKQWLVKGDNAYWPLIIGLLLGPTLGGLCAACVIVWKTKRRKKP